MSISAPDTASFDDDAEPIEIIGGRQPAPYVMVPTWIVLAASPMARAVYEILAAHLNVDRSDRIVWPSRKLIAQLCGVSRAQTIDPYITELAAIGAVEVVNRANGRGMKRSNAYIVHHDPPDGYTGPRSLAEFYAQKRGTAGRPDVRSTAQRSDLGKDGKTAGRPDVRSTAQRCAPDRTTDVRSTAHEVKQEELKQPPPPAAPSVTPASGATAGVQEEEEGSSSEGTTAPSGPDPAALVDEATAGWIMQPTPQERIRIIRKASEALAQGATRGGVLHALTRDLETARNPIAVVTSRTRVDGWAAHDPAAGTPQRPVYAERCRDPRHDHDAPGADRFLYGEDDQILGLCRCAQPLTSGSSQEGQS